MSTTNKKPPTFSEIIASLLQPLQGSIPLDSLVEQIIATRTPNAENPRRAVLNKISELDGELLVRLEPQTIRREMGAPLGPPPKEFTEIVMNAKKGG